MDGILGLAMFALLMVLLFTGLPVAYVLGGVTLLAGGVGLALGEFNFFFLQALPQRIFGIMQNFTLIAIPFFIFMGLILERAKIAEDLLTTAGLLFGRLKGGIGLSVVGIGALLAASTGVIGASVVAMGLISLPVMLNYGYGKGIASGIVVSAGSLGQILPPSIVLIVLGDQLGVSVVDLFAAALIPGLMLVGAYILFLAGLAFVRPELVPAIPESERSSISTLELTKRVLLVMIPPLLLIVVVLGSIFTGFATPTEAGAVGAIGAMVLCLLRGQLRWGLLRQALDSTARFTSMILFILIGATAFALVFRALDGDWLIRDLMAMMPGGAAGFVILTLLAIFILGFFIDFFEIVFILVPVLLPAAVMYEVDLIWYAILMALVTQTSFLTPPFGFALFYLRGVAPKGITTIDIYRGVVPFIALQVVVVGIVYIFPEIALWLPSIR
ncbi:TRAP transporter large permease subunit [Halomonas sp. 3H]|uniref:TRAP transporter large permease n=1 Tax=Halomonas sp. 3H TaxID=2952527 RepID=UPI0020B7B32B|nr:TRAP transporter large permease subunit [Halomonas sp. 3H]